MEPTETHKEFLTAYDQFADAIFRHCYFRVFNRDRAKDLMQETFTRVWEYLAEGKTVDNLRAFLYRVATNLIIDEARKKKAVSLETLAEEGFDPPAEDNRLAEGIDARLILRFLKEIEPPYREVVAMRYLEGLSPKEIAAALNENENAVSVRIHRGIKKLRIAIEHGA